jgi:hypothetical protein
VQDFRIPNGYGRGEVYPKIYILRASIPRLVGGYILRVQELANLVFGYGKNGFIMALKAYFDASGTDADPILTVGGYLTSDAVCREIENDWLAATNGKVFHLCDFGTKKCKIGSGTWSAPQRQEFLKRLAGIVNCKDVAVISVSIETSAYLEFLKKANYAEILGPPYSGCVQACVHFTEVTLLRNGLNMEPLAYTFEKGDREHELAKTLNDYEKQRNAPMGPRPHAFLPKDTPLLQPADLVAGVVRETLLRAHTAIGCLDNGLTSRTMLTTFEKYYSHDGLTSAVISGHDNTGCFVANPKIFETLDGASQRVATNNPKVVEKRLKQLNSNPKKRR